MLSSLGRRRFQGITKLVIGVSELGSIEVSFRLSLVPLLDRRQLVA